MAISLGVYPIFRHTQIVCRDAKKGQAMRQDLSSESYSESQDLIDIGTEKLAQLYNINDII